MLPSIPRRVLVAISLLLASAGGPLTAEAQVTAAAALALAPDNSADTLLLDRIHRFLDGWRAEWHASEADRHTLWNMGMLRDSLYRERLWRVNCMERLVVFGDAARTIERPMDRAIQSSAPQMALCPAWFPPWLSIPGDERRQRDAALAPEQRPAARAARAVLLDSLATAVQEAPMDGWRIGQLVRFAVDQQDTSRIALALRACRATPWWCAVLEGYARHGAGDVVGAEAAYQRARRSMPPSVRCWWTDLAWFLDWRAREDWRALSCAARDSVAERLWWLADPLWGEPGNARRVEHDSRLATVVLHSSLGRDERYDWRPEHGGSAPAALIVRYGWPAYVFWAGPDWEQTYFVVHSRRGANVPKGYTLAAPEYPVGRVALLPTWARLLDPFATMPEDWAFSAPRDSVKYSPAPEPALGWWPVEHAPTAYPLVHLPDAQTARLARPTGTLHLVSTDPDVSADGSAPAADRDSLDALLLSTSGPEHIDTLALRRLASGGNVVLEGLDTAAGPRLMAVEVGPMHPSEDSSTARRRLRYAGSPLPRLGAAIPALGVSVPVLLGAPGGRAPLPTSRDSVLARMLPTTRLGMRPAVGLYWETYSLRDGDTVSVTIRLTSHVRSWRPRWLGGPSPSTTVVRWQELVRDAADGRQPMNAFTQHGRVVLTQPAGGLTTTSTTIHAWWRVVELGALPAGRYSLKIGVRRFGTGQPTEVISAAREFAVGDRKSAP